MNNLEGCVYNTGKNFRHVLSQNARPPIYNNTLVYLIFHKCEGDIAPMSGIATFPDIVLNGETYSPPEFAEYYEQAIPVTIQQTENIGEPVRWGMPTSLSMQTYTYGSQNGYLVNALKPPLGAYCDLALTKRVKLTEENTLMPNVSANGHTINNIIRAGDIFTVNTNGVEGKCLYSLIPYTTYHSEGARCLKIDDEEGSLIRDFYENPDFVAYTSPCSCNPEMSECLTHKENFEIDELIANGEYDEAMVAQSMSKKAKSSNYTIAVLVVLSLIFAYLFYMWYTNKGSSPIQANSFGFITKM